MDISQSASTTESRALAVLRDDDAAGDTWSILSRQNFLPDLLDEESDDDLPIQHVYDNARLHPSTEFSRVGLQVNILAMAVDLFVSRHKFSTYVDSQIPLLPVDGAARKYVNSLKRLVNRDVATMLNGSYHVQCPGYKCRSMLRTENGLTSVKGICFNARYVPIKHVILLDLFQGGLGGA